MVKRKMPNEHKLIFLCTRLQINSTLQQEIKKLLDASINWNEVIEISKHHEILPFLYYNLNKLELQDVIPQEIYCIFKNYYYVNLDKNIRFYKELSSILESTNRVQIGIVLLKGINLIETIYNNAALRAMADIDILVKEAELSRLKAILFQLGYREIPKNLSAEYIRKFRIAFGFTKSIATNLSLYLDIHRALVPARPYKINLPQLWERTREQCIAGQKTTFLSFEDTLLSLALHLRGHMRQPLHLKSISDIAELLNLYRNTLDWAYIQVVAKKNHIANNIYFALYISKELLNASVSDELLNEFRPAILQDKLMYLCMNKHNFLKAKVWQTYFLRFLLFDRAIDFFLYLWRVYFLERFIAKENFRKILRTKIIKKTPNIEAIETIKK